MSTILASTWKVTIIWNQLREPSFQPAEVEVNIGMVTMLEGDYKKKLGWSISECRQLQTMEDYHI